MVSQENAADTNQTTKKNTASTTKSATTTTKKATTTTNPNDQRGSNEEYDKWLEEHGIVMP